MEKLFSQLSEEKINLIMVILSAENIDFKVVWETNGWEIHVPPEERGVSLTALHAYFKENRSQAALLPPLLLKKTYAGYGAALAILAWHIGYRMDFYDPNVIRAYEASAFRICQGELYRTLTALFLHIDPVHLAGNMVGLSAFATFVCMIQGWGIGLFLILLSGMSGNLLNGLMYQTGHHAIGASTAVFGALGIITGYQFFRKWKIPAKRMMAWMPIGAALALLALLGASSGKVDIMAHFYGLFTGCLIGLLYAATLPNRLPETYQWACFLMSLGIMYLSYLRIF